MKLDLEPCIPPVWARGGHEQTLFGHFLPSPVPRGRGEKLLILLPDGDELIATLYRGRTDVIVLAFHGLTGNSESTYINRTVILAQAHGHSVIAVNHRGCGAGLGLARGPYHSGRGDDVSEVIKFTRKYLPGKKIVAVGFSLSGNALLTLLTGQRGTEQPDFAVAVNGPCDLRACAELLKKGFNRVYDFNFVNDCRKTIYDARDRGLIDFHETISPFAHLRRVDELYTAPFGGFKDADEYYDTCSTFKYLGNIKTPSVIITAKDDPFIAWEPYLNAQDNPNVILRIENIGGHLGYLTRGPTPFSYRRWLDVALDKILAGIDS